MKFTSLNKKSPPVSFEEAIFLGLAPDGGMYVPEHIPQFTKGELDQLPQMSLHDIATLTLHKWLHDELSKSEIEDIVHKAISFPIPLIEVGGYKVLELFHGPTMSFKDVAAKILAHTMKTFMKKKKRAIKLLMATSGDTGIAVGHSYTDIEDARAILLFSKDLKNKLKREQLLRIGNNVLAIEVDGTYADCHRLVRQAFADRELDKLGITSANSINVGRLLPQIIYFVYLYALMYPSTATLVIPTNNFGNSTTALLTQLMGIPFDKIILATTEENFVSNYAESGRYNGHHYSPDQITLIEHKNFSNFPRILHFCGYSHKRFRELFDAHSVGDSKTVHMMHAVWHEYNYLIEPGVARAWVVADAIATRDKNIVIVTTSSPQKFAEEIHRRAGIHVDDHSVLAHWRKKKSRLMTIPNDYAIFKSLVIKEFSSKG
jgi:threonine synthase